ncbi:MAG: hypothetical protein ACTSW2_07600 [Alphaproteobacteria bacterium]
MNDGLRGERLALPLVEAAVRLGISAETLRLRLERGEERGFKRDGTSFVYVNDFAAERRFGGPAADAPRDAPVGQTDGAPVDGTLPVVVEFQKLELTRLLRENERLNSRLDQLFDEIRHLRDMQQREQVLRQQEQAMRRQNQETLDRLTSRPALPSPNIATGSPAAAPPPPPESAERRPELVLTRAVAAKSLDKDKTKSVRRNGSVFLATGNAGRKLAGSDRREPHTAIQRPAPDKPTAYDFPTTSAHAPVSQAIEDGTIGPDEAAELAVILNDIGHSLRDSEAFRRYPPIKPGPAPQRAGDRRPTDILPGRGTVAMRAKGVVSRSLPAEDTALLAILDSMGPTAEDRRTAARDLRRLLRNRRPPRAGEV